jgi:tetratricopeptide (TPR) repeat protein
MLQVAVEHHQAGRLEEAEEIYRRILREDPDQPDALHLAGLVAFQHNDSEAAIRDMRRAIELKPDSAPFHNNLASVYLAVRRLDEAAACCSRALQIQPDFAEAQGNRGRLLALRGELPQAIEAYGLALKSNPQSSKLHFHLGEALWRTDRIEEALDSFRTAVRLDPGNHEAFSMMGCVLLEAGRADEAVECFRRAIQIESDGPDIHVNLARALRQAGRLDEAEACSLRALEIDPRAAAAHYVLGAILLIRGRLAEAAGRFRNALALDPDHADARLALSGLIGGSNEPDEELERTEQRLRRQDLPKITRCKLHFALGKEYDRRRQWERAFHHYREGNRAAGATFDQGEFQEGVDAIIETFTDSLLARTPTGGNQSDLPIYVVGMPRSGTTLVEQILSSHPAVAPGGEIGVMKIAGPLVPNFSSLDVYPRSVGRFDAGTIRRLADACLERLRAIAGGASRATDKTPSNFLHLGLISLLLPNAKVIHCRRHPLDTCLSCYFQYFPHRVDFAYDLDDLGVYYRHYQRVMDHWRSRLRLPMLEVQYEELVADQEAVSRRLIDFCGLPWHDGCLEFHRNPRPVLTLSNWQVRRPIYTHSIGRWKHYEPFLEPLKKSLGWSATGE